MKHLLCHFLFAALLIPFSVSAVGIDDDTVLMLHMDGSDGSASFTDSSSANHSVTVFGDAQHDTSQTVFGSQVATAFDGVDDYYNSTDSALLQTGSLTWALEFQPNSFGNEFMISNFGASTHVTGIGISLLSATQLRISAYKQGAAFAAANMTVPTMLTDGTWYKLLVTYDESTGNVSMHSAGNTYTSTAGPIGGFVIPGDNFKVGHHGSYFNGSMRNLEVYDGAATNPHAWVPGDVSSLSGTTNLVMQSISANNVNDQGISMTEFGSPAAEYDNGVATFDGTGDYLSIPDNGDFDFPGAFTIDAWVYAQGDSYMYIAGSNPIRSGGVTNPSWSFLMNPTNNRLAFALVTGTGIYPINIFDTSFDFLQNTWYHVAVTRDNSDVIRMFVDGNQLPTTTTNNTVITNALSTIGVGGVVNNGYSYYSDGYLDEVRISKGVARWTSNFTPDITPYSVPPVNPSVTSITSTDTAGDFESGDTVALDVAFDLPVVLNGTGSLIATMSNGDAVTLNVSGSNATGTYTVSDAAAGSLSVSSLATEIGTTLESSEGNAADLTVPANLSGYYACPEKFNYYPDGDGDGYGVNSSSEYVCPGNETGGYAQEKHAFDFNDGDDSIYSACSVQADCRGFEVCDTGNGYCVDSLPQVTVTVETAELEPAVVAAVATVTDVAAPEVLEDALEDVLMSSDQQDVLDTLKVFAQVVNETTPVKTVENTAESTYVHAERVVDGTVDISNAELDATLEGVPVGNTIVVTTAGENSEIEKPANLTGDLLIFDMVNAAGEDVTEGFSIDVSVDKDNPGDVVVPNLVIYNETTGRFEQVDGSTVTDGGTTWDFTLTHFSTYALQVSTGFDDVLSGPNRVTDAKAVAYLEYSRDLIDDEGTELPRTLDSNKAVNGIREALKKAYVNGDSLDTIRDLTNAILNVSSSSTIASISKEIRAWRLSE